MARKKKNGDEGGGESWMNTYADMVTLLLTFFVMLFSMSSVSEEKWEMLLKAFTNQGDETAQIVFDALQNGEQLANNYGTESSGVGEKDVDIGNSLPQDFNELYEYLKAYVETSGMSGSVDLQKKDGSIFIRFRDSIFFNADSYDLKPEGMDLLNFLGDCLKSVENDLLVININGHTATVQGVQNYKISDRRLSSQRADSVAIFFEEQKLIDPKKILSIGYGKNFPVEDNDTIEGMRSNRRVDMTILSNDSSAAEEGLLKLLQGTFDETLYPSSGEGEKVLLPDAPGDSPEGQTPETTQAPATQAPPADNTPAQPSPGAQEPGAPSLDEPEPSSGGSDQPSDEPVSSVMPAESAAPAS